MVWKDKLIETRFEAKKGSTVHVVRGEKCVLTVNNDCFYSQTETHISILIYATGMFQTRKLETSHSWI